MSFANFFGCPRIISSVNMATAGLTDNFRLASAIVVHKQRLVIKAIDITSIVAATVDTVIIECYHIIMREQFATKIGQQTDLFELVQMDQYSLLAEHAHINFDPFQKPFYLDLIIVSFGMIGPFAIQF